MSTGTHSGPTVTQAMILLGYDHEDVAVVRGQLGPTPLRRGTPLDLLGWTLARLPWEAIGHRLNGWVYSALVRANVNPQDRLVVEALAVLVDRPSTIRSRIIAETIADRVRAIALQHGVADDLSVDEVLDLADCPRVLRPWYAIRAATAAAWKRAVGAADQEVHRSLRDAVRLCAATSSSTSSCSAAVLDMGHDALRALLDYGRAQPIARLCAPRGDATIGRAAITIPTPESPLPAHLTARLEALVGEPIEYPDPSPAHVACWGLRLLPWSTQRELLRDWIQKAAAATPLVDQRLDAAMAVLVPAPSARQSRRAADDAFDLAELLAHLRGVDLRVREAEKHVDLAAWMAVYQACLAARLVAEGCDCDAVALATMRAAAWTSRAIAPEDHQGGTALILNQILDAAAAFVASWCQGGGQDN